MPKLSATRLVFNSVSQILHELGFSAAGFRANSKAPRFPSLVTVAFLTLCAAPALTAKAVPRQQSVGSAFEVLAKSATDARETGKTEEALRDYQRAVEIRTDWEEGWWYLGTLQYDSDHFAEAIPALERVVQLDPTLASAWNFLGLCEFETQDYGNSLEHLQMGQKLERGDDPEIARVSRYHLAVLLNRSGDFEKASAMLASGIADQPPAPLKVALGLSLLRVPLLPQEIDPSQDALVQEAGETAFVLLQRDTASTLDRFRMLLKKYPDTPYLHYAFGIALASAARNDEALLQQHEELKISPKSALPYVEIALLDLRLRHPQDALRAAEMAVQLAPDSSAAHQALGLSLQALGQTQKTEGEFRMAQTLAPEKQVRDIRIVERYAHHATTVSPETSKAATNPDHAQSANLETLSRQAAASEAAGNTGEAIRIYEEALQGAPGWDEGRWNLAMLSYSSGRYAEAIAALQTYVGGKPNNGTAWAVMGLSEFETKDYGNALIHLRRGQELGMGGSAESVQLAKYRLAVLLNRSSEFDRATELVASDTGSGPRATQIQFLLGMALLRIPLLPEQVEAAKTDLVRSAGEVAILLRDSKYDEAFPKFQALLQRYPDTPFLRYAYGTALAALSQFDLAESQLRKELLISPASELPYVRLASIALKARRPVDALSCAQRAVQLAPDSAEAHYLLGRSFLELGQNEQAVQELEAARKMAPESPEIHFNLAKAYNKANLPEKAEQERASFARLNALAEQQRSRRSNQSYSGSHDETDLSSPAAPEKH